ncbi:Tesmin/TSO1-like CXC domain protein [Nitzschia inconspicua]|uniref:Tesmin/TSO1-like CXC domain protein n=1 Tax=Nitzschia inconspicua TaxID=303405 RepID=A0A9K3PV83_9STRA|nr:Tesmin/TSO1-like CXC domain protein [Nitzschia inconspicua]KAG7361030.1 Tesmin/TSO1-like CXC domain protein [Nitzschia inconspicua]
MDDSGDIEIEFYPKSPLPLLKTSQSWNPSFSAIAMQRQDSCALPHHQQQGQENVSAFKNYRHFNVTFAPEANSDVSPDLRTLAGHNMMGESSECKPLGNATNNKRSSDSDMYIPDYSRARGPWKKRFSPPGPDMPSKSLDRGSSNPPSLLRSTTSCSVFNTCSGLLPLLRQATSAALLQQAGRIPPVLQFHPSTTIGESLIAEALLTTPHQVGVFAKKGLSSASSFQPHPEMILTPAEALLSLKSSKEPPSVVTNQPDLTPGTFHRATPYATLLRQDSSQASLASCERIVRKNREGVFDLLHASSSTPQISSPGQGLHTMFPFSARSRGSIRGPPRRPYFSPIPTNQKRQTKNLSPTIDLEVSAKTQPKPQSDSIVGAGRPVLKLRTRSKKTNSRNISVSQKKDAESSNRAKLGTIITKRSLFKGVPISDRSCKCGSTHCLKLYCECFHGAMFCDPARCRCKSCKNTEAHNSVREPKGARVEAILSILSRRPRAFVHGGRKAVADREGCRCQRSGCLKKYCECVAGGRKCSDACVCTDCQNC